MRETITALAMALPGEEELIKSLAATNPAFASLVARYESLASQIEGARLDEADPIDAAVHDQLDRQHSSLLEEISRYLMEEEEALEDRRMR